MSVRIELSEGAAEWLESHVGDNSARRYDDRNHRQGGVKPPFCGSGDDPTPTGPFFAHSQSVTPSLGTDP